MCGTEKIIKECIKECIKEKITMTVVISKIDRLVVELKLPP